MNYLKQSVYLLLIIVLTILTFYAVRDFDFVNWDDQVQVVSNPDLENLSLPVVRKIFSSFYVGMYQPLTTLSYAIDYAVFGIQKPSGFHLMSLTMHLMNIIFLFILFKHLKLTKIQTFVLVLFFAVHPIQVEAVTWISARSTLLFSMFYLLALIFYVRYSERRNVSSILISFCFFICSLLSKPSAASFFLMIPVVDYWITSKLRAGTFLRMLIFVIPALFALILTYFSRNDTGVFNSLNEVPIFQHIAFAMWSVLLYAFHLFFPVTQKVYQLYPAFGFHMVIIPFFVFILFLLMFIRLKNYRRIMLMSAGLFLIPLSVHLKIIPFGDQYMADRYMYLSVPGLFFAPALLLLKKKGRNFKQLSPLFAVLLICIGLFFAGLSFVRKNTWKNSIVLWTFVIENNTDNYIAYYNRGHALKDKGRILESINDFSMVVERKPDYAEAYFARGTLYSGIKNFMKAIEDFDKTVQLNPELYQAYYNRANSYYNSGNYTGALHDYNTFLTYDSTHEKASFYVILSMIQLNYNATELIKELNLFIHKFPENQDGYYLLGIIYMEQNPQLACENFSISAKLGNSDAEALVRKLCIQ